MKIIKKFTAIKLLEKETKMDMLIPKLEYGKVDYFFDRLAPTTEFDSEDEAIEYAYNKDKDQKWLIVPIIKFKDK